MPVERKALILHCKENRKICGSIEPPADKSITIRSIILGLLSQGRTTIENPLISDATLPLLEAIRKLGGEVQMVNCSRGTTKSLVISRSHRFSLDAMKYPREIEINLGGSATAFRLLAGALCGLAGKFILRGDETLEARPMSRIVDPLRLMNARIAYLGKEGFAPLRIEGTKLKSIEYELPVASAQVKSSILLAGLMAEGKTSVIESSSTRDHTERMLPLFGAEVEIAQLDGKRKVSVWGASSLKGAEVEVPGDFSSAFLPITLSILLPDSALETCQVGLNPMRTGALRVLQDAGATIQVELQGKLGQEPIGRIVSRNSQLKSFFVDEDEIPEMIDELPLLALIATQAEGISSIAGASELRIKESDRAFHTLRILQAFGADVRLEDGMLIIKGRTELRPTDVEVPNDHRMAMLALACALLAGGKSVIRNFSTVDASWPGLAECLAESVLSGVSLKWNA